MPAWIFQANPKQFDVDEHLRRPSPRTWLVRPEQFGARMERGDRAFIWRADGGNPGTGGVVALGRLKGPPDMRAAEPDTVDLVQPGASAALNRRGESLRVWITLEEVRLTEAEGMLPRSWMLERPRLSNLWILRFAARTTYPLTDSEEAELMAAWSGGE